MQSRLPVHNPAAVSARQFGSLTSILARPRWCGEGRTRSLVASRQKPDSILSMIRNLVTGKENSDGKGFPI